MYMENEMLSQKKKRSREEIRGNHLLLVDMSVAQEKVQHTSCVICIARLNHASKLSNDDKPGQFHSKIHLKFEEKHRSPRTSSGAM